MNKLKMLLLWLPLLFCVGCWTEQVENNVKPVEDTTNTEEEDIDQYFFWDTITYQKTKRVFNSIEVKDTIEPWEYWSTVLSGENSKFVILKGEIENISNEERNCTEEAINDLWDQNQRRYKALWYRFDYHMYFKDYILDKPFKPWIKRSFTVVYEVAKDSNIFYSLEEDKIIRYENKQ